MNVKAVEWAWGVEGLVGTQRVTLLTLARHANEHGETHPMNKNIVVETALCYHAMLRNLKALQKKGLITDTGLKVKGHGKTRIWKLNMGVANEQQ